MASDQIYAVAGDDIPLTNQSLLELGRDVLARGAALRFRALGHSMSPFIRDGDTISLEPLGNASPRLGDVLACTLTDNNTLVVHRVVAVARKTYLLQGDNTSGSPDGWITADQVLGQVRQVEREGQRIHLGLGPERIVLALLSRLGLLIPLLRAAARLAHFIGVR